MTPFCVGWFLGIEELGLRIEYMKKGMFYRIKISQSTEYMTMGIFYRIKRLTYVLELGQFRLIRVRSGSYTLTGAMSGH